MSNILAQDQPIVQVDEENLVQRFHLSTTSIDWSSNETLEALKVFEFCVGHWQDIWNAASTAAAQLRIYHLYMALGYILLGYLHTKCEVVALEKKEEELELWEHRLQEIQKPFANTIAAWRPHAQAVQSLLPKGTSNDLTIYYSSKFSSLNLKLMDLSRHFQTRRQRVAIANKRLKEFAVRVQSGAARLKEAVSVSLSPALVFRASGNSLLKDEETREMGSEHATP